MGNTFMNVAKEKKNDEFYTRYEDIEDEISLYWDCLEDKIVYCNADDPKRSNFWKYFMNNFDRLGLRELRATYLGSDYIYRYDGIRVSKEYIGGGGDFREYEEVMRSSDVVVTNPPFSLFRTMFEMFDKTGVDFIILGCNLGVTYVDTSRRLIGGEVFLGRHRPKNFNTSTGTKQVATYWYNSFRHMSLEKIKPKKSKEDMELIEYDNCKAVEVGRLADIPVDYFGVMGVPMTYYYFKDDDMFEVLGSTGYCSEDMREELQFEKTRVFIDGQEKFHRVFIRRCD